MHIATNKINECISVFPELAEVVETYRKEGLTDNEIVEKIKSAMDSLIVSTTPVQNTTTKSSGKK